MKQYLLKDIILRENANPKLYITLHIKQSTVCNPDNLQINVWTVNKKCAWSSLWLYWRWPLQLEAK